VTLAAAAGLGQNGTFFIPILPIGSSDRGTLTARSAPIFEKQQQQFRGGEGVQN
jgi:hypothetical protein